MTVKMWGLALVSLACACFLTDLHMAGGILRLLPFVPAECRPSMLHTLESVLRPLLICFAVGLSFRFSKTGSARAAFSRLAHLVTTCIPGLMTSSKKSAFTAAASTFLFFNLYAGLFVFCHGLGVTSSYVATRTGHYLLGESIFKLVRTHSEAEFGATSGQILGYESDISGKVGSDLELAVSKAYGINSLEMARILEQHGHDYFKNHDYANAEEKYERALLIYFKKIANYSGTCGVLGDMADTLVRAGCTKDGRSALQAAITLVCTGKAEDSYALSLKRDVAEKVGLVHEFDAAIATGKQRTKQKSNELSPFVKYGSQIKNGLIFFAFTGTFFFRYCILMLVEERFRKAQARLRESEEFEHYFACLRELIDLELVKGNVRSADYCSKMLLSSADEFKVSLDAGPIIVERRWINVFDLRTFLTPPYVVALGWLLLQYRYF